MSNTSTPAKQIGRGERGQTLIMVAAMLPVLLGVTGLAVDVGMLYHHKRRMQTAADAGALAGAHEMWRSRLTKIVPSGRTESGTNGFSHGGSTVVNVYHPPISGYYIGNTRYVEVQIQQPSPTYFMSIFGFNDVDINARAVAGAGANGQHCIYALDPSMPSAFRADSSSILDANCGVMVNSTSSSAMHLTSSANVTASVVNVHGDYVQESSSVVTPTPNTYVDTEADPLSYLQPPTYSGCNHTNWERDSGTHTLNPGVYCNGIRLKNDARANLNPGEYIILGGGITLESNAWIVGTDVFFYLTGSSTYPYKPLDFQSSAQVRLKAPTTGPYAGILFFQDRTMASYHENRLASSVNSFIEGAVYLPTQVLVLESSTTLDAAYTIIVARNIRMQSSANFKVRSNYSSLSGGSPIKKLTLVE